LFETKKVQEKFGWTRTEAKHQIIAFVCSGGVAASGGEKIRDERLLVSGFAGKRGSARLPLSGASPSPESEKEGKQNQSPGPGFVTTQGGGSW